MVLLCNYNDKHLQTTINLSEKGLCLSPISRFFKLLTLEYMKLCVHLRKMFITLLTLLHDIRVN
jgi:hypothetical protein